MGVMASRITDVSRVYSTGRGVFPAQSVSDAENISIGCCYHVKRTVDSPIPVPYTEAFHSGETFGKTFAKGRIDPTIDQSMRNNSAITKVMH